MTVHILFLSLTKMCYKRIPELKYISLKKKKKKKNYNIYTYNIFMKLLDRL